VNRERKLLFVGAHPDDETFGVGGTLAKYAAEGVKVYYACATRGEVGEVDPQYMKGFATAGDVRWSELKCAAKIIGLQAVFHLGYRDSGMEGSTDNKHPMALTAAPVEEVAGRIVKLIREIGPQVVITFDPIGGYRHPDHIAVHNATVEAFREAGEQSKYPVYGPPFSPQKLYFHLFPRGLLRLAVRLMPVFGQDPHRFGRNKDIDLASVANVNYPVNASVRLSRRYVQARDSASACHASQMGGGPRRRGPLAMVTRFFGQRDLFMRAYPPPQAGRREKDLFERVT
jgi:N-acetyl-1-D-myo-inositol-2-amino-2-deoxy-alpha-D-glucopyranoside deacetylase